jgi:shikimate kinase
MDKNIALVGFMGSGKTTVAFSLAKKLKRKLVSTDDIIVQKEQCPITDIFACNGEKYFRSLEKEVVVKLAKEEDLVIDCGGGIVLQEENILNLKKNGIIIYLKATVDVLYERTKNDAHRPLLNVSDPKAKIKELLLKREPFYAKGDYTIDTSEKSVNDVVDAIIQLTQNG